MRKIAAGLVLIGMVMASAPVQAGGWAVLTLDAWPDRVTTNKSFTIGFVLRQHGQTLLGGQSGTVFFEKGRQQVQFKVVEAGSVGHYTATVTLPQTGAWQWRIAIFGEHEMPALMVQDAAIVVAAARHHSHSTSSPGQDIFRRKRVLSVSLPRRRCGQREFYECLWCVWRAEPVNA